LEDKRLRRELQVRSITPVILAGIADADVALFLHPQETYGKLLEASLGMASRSLEAVPPQYRWSKDPTNGSKSLDLYRPSEFPILIV
jgi:hypothetical protein